MTATKFNILSTRPLDETLIGSAAAQGISIDTVSFIDIEFNNDEQIMNEVKALFSHNITAVFTSMNAVEAIISMNPPDLNWTIYCIGNTTSELISNHFKKCVIAGSAKNAAELATVIINDNVKTVHFFCGDIRRPELPGKLESNGIHLTEHIVYNTILTPQVVSKQYDGILFFSPSAVESYFTLNAASEHQQYFAIGATTAAAINSFSKNIIEANETSKTKLVEQVLHYYQQPEQH